MSLLRYIIQGFGWEVGAQAAREGIKTLREDANDASDEDASTAAAPSPRDERRRARELQKATKRNAAEIERQLRDLKKQARK